MTENKQNDDVTKTDIDDSLDNQEQDNLNSTMMSIDVSNLDLKGADTKTEIKIEMPSDDEIIQEQLEKKKSFFAKLLHKIFPVKKEQVKTSRKELPGFLNVYMNVWVCNPRTPIVPKIFFYLLRLLILGISVYLHYFLFAQVLPGLESGHVAQKVLVALLGVDVLVVLFALLLKWSPGWVVALPVTVLSLFFSYFALFLHTADPYLFVVNSHTISGMLAMFYILAIGYVLVLCVLEVGESLLGKLFFGLIAAVSLAPMIICFLTKQSFEVSFFGQGSMANWPYYLQPIYLLLHVLLPVLGVVFLLLALLPVTTVRQKERRGFVRGLAIIVIGLTVLGFSLMQKNRVYHVFNFVIPQKLSVGGALLSVQGHDLRIETNNFNKEAGKDRKSRYHFNLKKGKNTDQLFLQVVDQYDFPVRGLTASDVVVYNDGERVKKFKFNEAPHMDSEKGNYILGVNLEEKKPLIIWDKKKSLFTTKDDIEFNLTDLSLVKQIKILHNDEILLNETNPKTETLKLPLSYFGVGDYKLNIMLFDEKGGEVYKDVVKISVTTEPELGVLLPVDGDVVGKKLSVLSMPKHIDQKNIKSVSYDVDGKVLYTAKQDFFYNQIDIAELKPGEHVLNVIIDYDSKKLSKKVRFIKNGDVALLNITSPTMGAFAEKEVNVSYGLNQNTDEIVGVKLFVNGDVFQDFTIEENSLTLPVSRWLTSELYITIQATLEKGHKVSDWVQVNKGLSVLDLQFNLDSLDFLNYKDVVVVLDASISNLDSWYGKEKWRSLKKVVVDPKIDKKIKKLNPTYFIFGHNKPYSVKDCKDNDVLIKQGGYNRTYLKRQLSKQNPTGVSAVKRTLKKAYKANPDKIYLFADNKDSCSATFKDIDALIKKSPQTQVVVFALGQITEDSKEWLKKLANKTNGHFYQPDDYDDLVKIWLSEMDLSYELYLDNKLIGREALGNKKYYLTPGEYTLKIPYGLKMEEVKLNLENSANMLLEISGEKETIQVKQVLVKR